MNTSRIIGGGLLAGVVFYALSLIVWALFKFLPVVPLSVAIPAEGLGRGWQIEHLVVSLVTGILFAIGYGVYGKARAGGWLYGGVIFVAAIAPGFIAHFVINPEARSIAVYGAIVSLLGALLGGKAVAMTAKS